MDTQRPSMALGPDAGQDARSLPLPDTPTRGSLQTEICRAFVTFTIVPAFLPREHALGKATAPAPADDHPCRADKATSASLVRALLSKCTQRRQACQAIKRSPQYAYARCCRGCVCMVQNASRGSGQGAWSANPGHSQHRQQVQQRNYTLLSAPLTIPLICSQINRFRRASRCGEAMTRRRKGRGGRARITRHVKRWGCFSSRVRLPGYPCSWSGA